MITALYSYGDDSLTASIRRCLDLMDRHHERVRHLLDRPAALRPLTRSVQRSPNRHPPQRISPDRAAALIEHRRRDPHIPQYELARIHGISQPRVSQILLRAGIRQKQPRRRPHP